MQIRIPSPDLHRYVQKDSSVVVMNTNLIKISMVMLFDYLKAECLCVVCEDHFFSDQVDKLKLFLLYVFAILGL